MRISRIIIGTLFTVAGTTSFARGTDCQPQHQDAPHLLSIARAILRGGRPRQHPRSHRRPQSALYPYALSINRPHQLAHRQGWNRGTITLERQPASLEEAIAWTHWLFAKGITVSIGLLQVNSEHAALLHLTPEQLFDPCTNLRAGAALLSATYTATARSQGRGPRRPRFRSVLLQHRISYGWTQKRIRAASQDSRKGF